MIKSEENIKIAAITMVYNEPVFLPLWIKHYGTQIGRENLIVIDQSSNDGSTDDINTQVIRVPQCPLDEIKRAGFISQIRNSLALYYDVVIYTDVDEFLFADPLVCKDLKQFISTQAHPLVAGIGLDVLHLVESEPSIDLQKPILSQRAWVKFNPFLCKPLIPLEPVVWTSGFHQANRSAYLHTDLYMFHLKSMDRNISHANLVRNRTHQHSERTRQEGISGHFRWSTEQHDEFYFSYTLADLIPCEQLPFSFSSEISRVMSTGIDAPMTRFEGVRKLPHRFQNAIRGTNSGEFIW